MSTYKGIFGKTIKHLSSDPDNSTYEGQIWYNTTEGKFKTVVALSAFVSSSPYPTAIFGNMGAGIQTAALSFGGTANPSTPSSPLTLTQEYNGSGWTAGGSMSQKRRSGIGFGIQTAALGSTGYTYPTTNLTEEYDGSTWTAGGNYPVSQELGGGCGTQTAGLGCGGNPPSNISNEYDGSSWTASPGTLNTARRGLTVTGTQTAGLAASSADSPNATACEEYNGSTWTTVNSMNTSRANVSFGSGIQTASILYSTPGTLESYDGTNWTNDPATMGTARNSGSSAGTSTASLACCGSPGSFTSLTEEYNFTANTVTAAAWSSAPTLPESRYTNAGAGTVTAALNWGGVPPTSSTTAEYDGSSWSTGGAYPKAIANHGGTGLQTAALSVCGLNPASPPAYNDSFEYDGTSWGSPATYPQQGFGTRVWGIQTSAVATGGGAFPSPQYNTTVANSYNGTSWTSETAFSTVRSFHSTGGANDTAGIVVGGRSTPGTETAIDDTEEYNGTSWTAGGDYITVVKECTGWGTVTDQMQAGGSTPTAVTTCAIYDGTAWATTAALSTKLTLNATTQGTFNTNSGFTMGGSNAPGITNAVEQFTPESTSINIESVDNS